ncbi:hypothetical protein HaLaN_30039 [Haematococcus lacustris]|uniref:Uncharacterized protein n=1 Tax=Haematococcus lacustris TaxID=44745 RepID=A0A6A0AEN7_HAELA|nr:hypothetical protein HaLaN_30039 [Haematococcus lacustris]
MSEAKLLRENNDRDLVESCSKRRGVAESFTQLETRSSENSGYAAVTVKLRGSPAVSGILQPRTQPAHRCGEQRNLFGARGQRGLGAVFYGKIKILTFPVM